MNTMNSLLRGKFVPITECLQFFEDDWGYLEDFPEASLDKEIIKDEYKENFVFVVEGDAHTDTLILGDACRVIVTHNNKEEEVQLSDLKNCYHILIQGNLDVDTIASPPCDEGVSLIVTGSLTVRCAFVGGRLISVNKNLTVKEYYIDTYGYGGSLIKGKATVPFLMDVYEYDFCAEKEDITVRVSDRDNLSTRPNEDFNSDLLRVYFRDEFFKDEHSLRKEELYGAYSWSPHLDGNKLYEACLTKKDILNQAPRTTSSLLDHVSLFTYQDAFFELQKEKKNFLKLFSYSKTYQTVGLLYEGDIDGEKCRVEILPEYEGVQVVTCVIGKDVFAVSYERSSSLSLLKKLYVVCLNKDEEGNKTNFNLFVGISGCQEFEEKFIRIWYVLLKKVEQTVFYLKEFHKIVTKEKILELVKLPVVVEKYNDWDDGDKNGFYAGGCHVAFRNPLLTSYTAQLRVSVQTSSNKEEYDCKIFRYECDEDDSVPQVVLRYCMSQLEKGSGMYNVYTGGKVSLFDSYYYKDAVRLFKKASYLAYKDNEEYLEDKKKTVS
jgi:hypothetical protein